MDELHGALVDNLLTKQRVRNGDATPAELTLHDSLAEGQRDQHRRGMQSDKMKSLSDDLPDDDRQCDPSLRRLRAALRGLP